MSDRLDLGEGHGIRFAGWAPDRDLNPQYADLPDVERYAAIVDHPLRPDDTLPECVASGRCEGAITFRSEVQQRIEPGQTVWDVASWDPLTLSPSLLCHCGDHGFIQGGRWVNA